MASDDKPPHWLGKAALAVLAMTMLAGSAAAQPFIIPLEPQKPRPAPEPPPPSPSPTPVAPPQASPTLPADGSAQPPVTQPSPDGQPRQNPANREND